MKTLLSIIFFLPIMALCQEVLIIRGKMVYADTKTATLQIIETENPTDTTTVQIEKKKFKLEPLDLSKSYELIFTCGEETKILYIKKREEKEAETYYSYYLELDWKNL
ncbi:MAG: hypothetical protein WDZ35_07930 [Crocinitomicaceae bacterium]